MDIEDLKVRLEATVNKWFSEQNVGDQKPLEVRSILDASSETAEEEVVPIQQNRVLPEGKRVVRTKTSGDRVYLLDEVKGTRRWVTNPEVLKSTGFEITDVTEVDDTELLKFQMGPALYRVED